MADKRLRKVLVVDDEKVVRDFLARLLSLEDMEVMTAQSGAEAIEIVKKDTFDIIFLDMRMPLMDGVETFRELKKITGDVKYIMMTGYSIEEALKKVENEKVEAFIRKPFEIEEIMNVLNDYSRQQYIEEITSVLVVESTERVLNLFTRLLKNYDVKVIKTGREALDQILHKDFELIFSDIVLSDMSGIEFYAKVKEIRPNLDIILIMGDTKKKEEIIKGCLYKHINELLR